MILFAGIEVPLVGVLCLAVGLAAGFLLMRWKDKNAREALAQQERSLLSQARRESDSILREARLAASEEGLRLRQQQAEENAKRRKELTSVEQGILERELALKQRQETLDRKEADLQQVAAGNRAREQDLQRLIGLQKNALEKIGGLNAETARADLLKLVEQEAEIEAGNLTRRILEDAKTRAADKARYIVSLAIQRYSGILTFESTTATITLPGDEIKGRIIGREGRNIRAFENATGVTVLIDDTPNAVVLSGFDPVRREIARESMQRLIQDGRIHPTRIEEVVAKVSEEMEDTILDHGESAARSTGIDHLHPDILKMLGRLYYRHSFSQNILSHSIEVAHLAGLIAGELGLDVALAKRAGLLHDIGKAVNHEVEGAHAIVGAEMIKRLGESEAIVNAVAAHHGDVPIDGPLSAVLAAADAISASRPGARLETMTTYLKRVGDLEKIGLSFEGVEKCFAVQAGRELRVLVQPEKIDDQQAFALARNLARKVENELQYPGQIRIVVMRETRNVELAK